VKGLDLEIRNELDRIVLALDALAWLMSISDGANESVPRTCVLVDFTKERLEELLKKSESEALK
jgi:hypothetical protein